MIRRQFEEEVDEALQTELSEQVEVLDFDFGIFTHVILKVLKL